MLAVTKGSDSKPMTFRDLFELACYQLTLTDFFTCCFLLYLDQEPVDILMLGGVDHVVTSIYSAARWENRHCDALYMWLQSALLTSPPPNGRQEKEVLSRVATIISLANRVRFCASSQDAAIMRLLS